MQMLTRVLSRAVPEVYVEHARVSDYTRSGLFFIHVLPDHCGYWRRFKKKYPSYVRSAQKRNARKVSGIYCPEFRSPCLLIDWLSEVLGLTEGERKLLLLDVRL